MFLFSGAYEHQLDAKNRIRIPAKLKGSLGNDYCFSKGPDGCIWILPHESLNEVIRGFDEEDGTSDAAKRAAKRIFLASVYSAEEDPQGRVVLPSKFKQYAKIEKNITFIGQSRYIELWSTEQFEQYSEGALEEKDFDISKYIKFL